MPRGFSTRRRLRRPARPKVDPVAAAFQHSAGLRTFKDDEVPEYAVRDAWPPVPHRVNNYPGQRLPRRCFKEELPRRDTAQHGPNGAVTGECFQLDLRGENETQPVLPTLFVPGFPKCATTWLYECMHNAFLPEMVCPAQPGQAAGGLVGRFRKPPSPVFDPRRWSKAGCKNRRFMLPGIACSVTGGCSHRKELFFYGAGFGDYFKVGMAALHGPELPLELFMQNEHRPSRFPGKRWEQYRVKRFEDFCYRSEFTHLPHNRMHPSCCTPHASMPKRWGCRWHETLRIRYGSYRSTWLQTAMPWVKPSEYEFASVDFTPNYLCHAGALKNIYQTARDPSELRFIVLMRDPIMRLFSEWSMFRLGWGWDHEPSFKRKIDKQMQTFRTCNATLFESPQMLMTLPDDELFAYMKRCFKGMAMEYVTNSLYPVCVLGALRVFKREQFLFLRFEDLMRMKAPALLRLISNFTGLYTDDALIRNVRERKECEAGNARKVPLSFTKKDNGTSARAARAQVREAVPMLERFFAPYDQMLTKLVHPAFQWSSQTHAIPV